MRNRIVQHILTSESQKFSFVQKLTRICHLHSAKKEYFSNVPYESVYNPYTPGLTEIITYHIKLVRDDFFWGKHFLLGRTIDISMLLRSLWEMLVFSHFSGKVSGKTI